MQFLFIFSVVYVKLHMISYKNNIGEQIYCGWLKVHGGTNFRGFLWRVRSTNSSTHEMVIFCIKNERKYHGHEFWTQQMCHFCPIHKN